MKVETHNLKTAQNCPGGCLIKKYDLVFFDKIRLVWFYLKFHLKFCYIKTFKKPNGNKSQSLRKKKFN